MRRLFKLKDLLKKIIAYEDGTLNDEETIELFQTLVETGIINELQGSYQRMAQYLVDEGLIENANDPTQT
tara:strand:- start:913 stop:1122 length:210 start_codon:yes stop_codon:yes gene_type:complete